MTTEKSALADERQEKTSSQYTTSPLLEYIKLLEPDAAAHVETCIYVHRSDKHGQPAFRSESRAKNIADAIQARIGGEVDVLDLDHKSGATCIKTAGTRVCIFWDKVSDNG